MTTIAPGSSDADTGAAEHAARVRKAHDTNISRAEGWRRRGPLLPALIFMIVVTQIPFLFTLYYSTLSWNLVRPGSRQFVGLQNYVDVVGDSTFWQVASRSARRSPSRSRQKRRWRSRRSTPRWLVVVIRRSHDNPCPRLVGRASRR